MAIKLKLMNRREDRVTYSLPSLSLLNERLVDEADWPSDKPFLIFRFPAARAPKGVPIRDMVSRRKYVCRTTYVGDKGKIPVASPDGGKYGLRLAPFRSLAEYRRTYIRSYAEGFLKRFSNYKHAGSDKEDRAYLKEQFPSTKGISVRKDGRVVGMLSMLHFRKDGRHYRPLSWVAWLWVDGKLPKEERKAAHGLLGGWIKKLPGKYFGGAIHAVNLKSQNWFIKMGARPVQVFFLRR